MASKKSAEYVPEIRKEVNYTIESPTQKDVKEGLSVIITKAELMDETYKVNECGAQAQMAEDPAKKTPAPTPAPASPFGSLLGGLAKMANAATDDQKKAPLALPGMAPKEYKVIEKPFLQKNAIVFKVDVKSDINHVLGFDKSHFLLKDPSGNLYKNKVIVTDPNWGYANWCATPEQSSAYHNRMNTIRDLQAAMVLPKDTYSAYVAFFPENREIQGDWKLLMYELPIATNNAGATITSDHFYSKAVVKKWESTFKKSTPKGNFEKIETKEVM